MSEISMSKREGLEAGEGRRPCAKANGRRMPLKRFPGGDFVHRAALVLHEGFFALESRVRETLRDPGVEKQVWEGRA
jgi:hypothetical protein